MTDLILRPGADSLAASHGGLLPPALRRDLTDLNAQYLELGLAPGLDTDPRFAWSDPVRRCLAEVDPATRARIATAPFALFQVTLPVESSSVPPARVEDSRSASAPAGWLGRCESFAHQALFLARRLVDSDVLALRVVLGLSDDGQAWLADCRLSQFGEIAANPRIIRPRWRQHLRFWEMLVGATRRGTPAALQWAHCVGLCLLGATDGEVAAAPRRRPRR